MPDLQLRTAQAADNAALIELERSCPQGSDIVISSERQDYFIRSRLYGNDRTLVVLLDGRIVGVLAGTIKELSIDGQVYRAAFLYDLRIHPDFRRTLGGVLMVKAWNQLERWAHEQDAAFIYGFIKGDNLIMQSFVDRKKFKIGGRMMVIGRPVYRSQLRRVSRTQGAGAIPVCSPEPAPDTMADFLATYGQRPLFPTIFTRNYISPAMAASGLAESCRLENGRSSASLGIVRLSETLATRVHRIPWYYNLARRGASLIAPLIPLPTIPQQGGLIRYWHVFNHTMKGPEGSALWKELMRHVNDRALAAGCSLLTSSFAAEDPMLRHFNQGAITRMTYLLGFKNLGGLPERSFDDFCFDIRDAD
jgi:hypothetical protein